MRKVNLHIVHCSASDDVKDDNIEAIRNLHTSNKKTKIKWGKYDTHGKGCSDVGYHYFIRKDGIIQKGRALDVMGAHCKGKNKSSVGTCLSGNNKKKFTPAQFKALSYVHRCIEAYYNKKIPLYGHNKYNNKKTCPNFDVKEFKEQYLNERS